MEQNNSRNWTVCLNYVIFVINNTICRATDKTPYELVFGMHLYNDNALMEYLFENKICIDEEEILENISIE